MRHVFVEVVLGDNAVPVGVALWPTGLWPAPRYFAFGHPTGNNSTQEDARAAYRGLVKAGFITVWERALLPLLSLRAHWGVPWPRLHHDLSLLAFLQDPHMRHPALTTLASKVLHEVVPPLPAPQGADNGALAAKLAVARLQLMHRVLLVLTHNVLTDKPIKAAYHRDRRLTRVLADMAPVGDVMLRFDQVGTTTGRVTTVPDLTDEVRALVFAGSRTHRTCVRAYMQLETRVAAHYERGMLYRRFNLDPNADAYVVFQQAMLNEIGKLLVRQDVKDLGMALLHGVGAVELALSKDWAVDTARNRQQALIRSLPGIRQLKEELHARARRAEPLRTWGGRRYTAELSYKLLPLLVQGSAADIMKQAAVAYYDAKYAERWPLVLITRDELAVRAPVGEEALAQAALRDAMEGVQFGVPLVTEGYSATQAVRRAKMANN